MLHDYYRPILLYTGVSWVVISARHERRYVENTFGMSIWLEVALDIQCDGVSLLFHAGGNLVSVYM